MKHLKTIWTLFVAMLRPSVSFPMEGIDFQQPARVRDAKGRFVSHSERA
jgi:hypothetical protein